MLWFAGSALLAQNIPSQAPVIPDSTRSTYRKPDSLRVRFYPRAFRVGTDVIALIKSQVDETFSGWELNGDVDFGRYYLAFDYGHWERSYVMSNGLYDNSGNYWRAGFDINLLTQDPDRNMLFFGFRYARSAYSENSTFSVTDPVFGDYQQQLQNPDVSAAWAELTTGLRVKVFKEFWMGYTARLKFLRSVKGDDELSSYDIPGYGLNSESFYWGFNYQLFWRIPFSRQR